MKIVGFIHIDDHTEMVLSADSSMLNQHKPFFVPDWSTDMRYSPCLVIRVSRLGKNISERFASRYYDAFAYGADFIAHDLLGQARATGRSWTEAIAFDYSLAIGDWQSPDEEWEKELAIPVARAIAETSRCMTIRQGDLIYIHYLHGALPAEKETTIEAHGLYCKIK